MSKAKKALLRANKNILVDNPKYFSEFPQLVNFNNTTAKELVRKSIRPHENMVFSQVKDRYKSAGLEVKKVQDKINKSQFLSLKELIDIEMGKSKLKEFYKSDSWAERAKKAGLTDNEIKATSDFLCDNVDRTIISGNPLADNYGASGLSVVYKNKSFGVPVVFFLRNPNQNTIIHELAHASEFNAKTKNSLNIKYYDNINPDALSGYEKLQYRNKRLSSSSLRGLATGIRKGYDKLSADTKDYLNYITGLSELRADRVASLLSEPTNRRKLFSPIANKIIDENIFTAAPTIGIAGLSAYDMLNNNL